MLETVKPLSFKEYQDATHTTASYVESIDGMFVDFLGPVEEAKKRFTPEEFAKIDKINNMLIMSYVGLGLVGEAGEVGNKLKKIIRDSKGVITPEVTAAISKELGGVLWYVSEVATWAGLDMGEVAQENLDVLKSRKERGVIQGSGDNR